MGLLLSNDLLFWYKNSMKITHFFAVLALMGSLLGFGGVAQAAIFDAADYLSPSQQSIGILGDMLLSNPSGEGVEAHFKQGINQLVNAEAFAGMGSSNRKFRAGGQANINFFPDSEGQIGISLLSGGSFIKREAAKAMEFHLTPLFHKEVDGFNGNPVNLYLGVPLFIELSQGRYITGSQVAFGGQWDLNQKRKWFAVSEAAISFNHAETYIALGIGTRFGTSPRESRVDEDEQNSDERKSSNKVRTIDSVDYNVEDLQSR
jgi:hypothetical protein